MWIMLIKKLPTRPSPPKLAIFWSTPWPDPKYVEAQAEDRDYADDPLPSPTDLRLPDNIGMGHEHNWAGARRTLFAERELRVFPDEFSVLDEERMTIYILSADASHDLVPEGVAEERLVETALDGDTKPIYEAALIDGCNHAEALATALGQDITVPNAEFPPLGWYRCKPEYARIYCTESEMVEDRSSADEEIVPQKTVKLRGSAWARKLLKQLTGDWK